MAASRKKSNTGQLHWYEFFAGGGLARLGPGPKSLPAERSFLSLDAADVVVSALKKSDTGNAIVLRAFDERGRTLETPVRFLGKEAAFRPANMLEEETGKTDLKRLQFKPYEIQTIRIPLP